FSQRAGSDAADGIRGVASADNERRKYERQLIHKTRIAEGTCRFGSTLDKHALDLTFSQFRQHVLQIASAQDRFDDLDTAFAKSSDPTCILAVCENYRRYIVRSGHNLR